MKQNLQRRVKKNELSMDSDEIPLRILHFIVLLSIIVNFGFPNISLANAVEKKKSSVVYKQTVLKSKSQISGVQTTGNFEERELGETELIKVAYTKYVTLTAYSSTVDQCDSTPFITANGTHVHDGTIAANFLRFGTKVRIPEYFGDQIFTVEDRTHPRYGDRVDIWMETRQQALNFGKRRLKIEVLE